MLIRLFIRKAKEKNLYKIYINSKNKNLTKRFFYAPKMFIYASEKKM